MTTRVILALALLLGLGSISGAQLASPYSNSVWPAQIFTASGQTGNTIQLNGLSAPNSTIGSSFSLGTITVTGTNLTTVTFAVMASSDNGATYYALPISTLASPSTTPSATITATANGLYQVSLGGITHIKLVTSGTFTATNVSLVLTASPNASVGRNNSGGGGGGGSGTVNTGAAAQLGRYPAAGTVIGPAPSLYTVDPSASISSQISGLPSGSTVILPAGTPQQSFTPGSLTLGDNRLGSNVLPLSSRGIACDARQVSVTLTASSTTATSPNQFQPSDVGRTISAGGKFGGTQWVFLPTITAFSSSSSVTISTPAPYSQTADLDPVGTMNTTALQNALTYLGGNYVGVLPAGCQILSETLAWNNNQSLLGQSVLGTQLWGVASEDIIQTPDASGQGGVSTPGVHLVDMQLVPDERIDARKPYTKVAADGTTTHPTPMYRPGMTNSPASNNPLGPGWAIGATNGVANITSGSTLACVPVALNRMPVSGFQLVFRDTPTIFKTTVSSLTGSCPTGFSPATMATPAPVTMSQAEWVSTSSVQALSVAVASGAQTYPQSQCFANSISPSPLSESNFGTHGRYKLGSEEWVYLGINYTTKCVNVVAGPSTSTGWAIGSAVAPENPCYTNYEVPWPVVPTVNSGDSTPSGANYFPAVCGGNAAISFPQANGNIFVGTGLSNGYLKDITIQAFYPDFSTYRDVNGTIGIYEGGNNASYGTPYQGINIEGTEFGILVGPASYGMHGVASVGPTSTGNHFDDITVRAAYPLIFQDMQQSHWDRMDTYSTGINPYDGTSIGSVTCMAFGYAADEQTGALVTVTAQNEITNWNCEPEGGSRIEVPPFTYSDQFSATFRQDTFEGPYNVFGGNQQNIEGGYLANPVIDYGTQNNFARTSLTNIGPVSNTWGVCSFCEWGSYGRQGSFAAQGDGPIVAGGIGTRQYYDGNSSETFFTGNFVKPYGNGLSSYIQAEEWNTNGAFDSVPMSVGKTLDATELYSGSYVQCNMSGSVECEPTHFGGFHGAIYIGPFQRLSAIPYDLYLNLETPAGAGNFAIQIWALAGTGSCTSGTQLNYVPTVTATTWTPVHIPVDFTNYPGCTLGIEFGPTIASDNESVRIGSVQFIPTPGWVLGPVSTPTEGAACPVSGAILGSDGSYLYVCSGSAAGAGTVKRVGIS